MDEKKKNNEEFWSRMTDQLRGHEESYQEGAWERFEPRVSPTLEKGVPVAADSSSARIRRMWTPWVSRIAAVVILLVGLMFYWSLEEKPDATEILLGESVEPAPIERTISDAEIPDQYPGLQTDPSRNSAEPGLSARTPALHLAAFEASGAVSGFPEAPETTTMTDQHITTDLSDLRASMMESEDIHLRGLSTDPALIQVPGLIPEPHDSGFGRFAEQIAAGKYPAESIDQYAFPSDNKTSNGRWGVGLMLASNMTTEKVNMGGGFTVDYHLNDRLSLQTGVALGQFGVNAEGVNIRSLQNHVSDFPIVDKGLQGSGSLDKESVVPTYHTRYLNNQTSSLLGMDIPINLKYALSDQFYTSVGVSFFGILDENRTNHFIDRINEPMVNDGHSADKNIAYSVRTVYVDAQANKHPLEGNGYAGFLNFSIGHKTRISRKLHLSLEPFFKLPVGRLAREDMNLTNGGIRIVTGF